MSRDAPIELTPDEFRALGHQLVDELADLIGELRSPASRRVMPEGDLEDVQRALGDAPLPAEGAPPAELLEEARELLLAHAPFTGHPRFLGYISGAPAPLGALGDLLAAVVSPNVGGWPLSRIATEIERQTVRWIAELIGYPADCGGLLVSGGNMANFVGFLAARRARAPWDVRTEGTGAGRLRAYCSAETHTWVQKAGDMFGLGTESVRWIPTDADRRIRVDTLRDAIAADRGSGDTPFLVVGTAGSVATGAIDPLSELAELCGSEELWFHVDGAYGGVAACLPDAPPELAGIALGDSVAVDPHKWLYAPLEAGCTLVRDEQALLDAFSYRPSYYRLGEGLNYFEYGPQNSRGFRALKVWLGLRQVGRAGYERMLRDDIDLARHLYELCEADPELEPRTSSLSITTFRYVPPGIDADAEGEYLDELNEQVLAHLNASGEAFVSNAIVDERFYLRACVVNFRTTKSDIEALVELVRKLGRELHAELRAETARA